MFLHAAYMVYRFEIGVMGFVFVLTRLSCAFIYFVRALQHVIEGFLHFLTDFRAS